MDLHTCWEENYEAIKSFIEKYGRYPSASSKNKEEKRLGVWCNPQRRNYKKGILQKYPDRVKKLEEINFEWDPYVCLDWEENYAKVKAYLEVYNRYPVQKSENKTEKRLSRWCTNQRTLYRKGTLQKHPDKIKKLEEINFEWHTPRYWERMYMKFKVFLEDYNKYPRAVTDDNKEKILYKWLKNQMRDYRNGTLQKHPDRIKKLEYINFEWDTSSAQWEEMYEKYAAFKRKHNREPRFVGDEIERKLARWCGVQRSNYGKGILQINQYRINKLEEVNFEWDPLGLQGNPIKPEMKKK